MKQTQPSQPGNLGDDVHFKRPSISTTLATSNGSTTQLVSTQAVEKIKTVLQGVSTNSKCVSSLLSTPGNPIESCARLLSLSLRSLHWSTPSTTSSLSSRILPRAVEKIQSPPPRSRATGL
ncbi:hypothetical protein CGCSCA5_v014416 [Colletotrichum siamense]|nr:hypothetical protein CGCSCA5_v014416 [Colletotrichum siamense]